MNFDNKKINSINLYVCSSNDELYSLTLRSRKRLCSVLQSGQSLIDLYKLQDGQIFRSETIVHTNDLFENVEGKWVFRGRADNEVKMLGRGFNLDGIKQLVLDYSDDEISGCVIEFSFLV